MKGKLIAVLAVVALFIPTFIAVGSYVAAQKSPVTDSAVSKMVISDIDGESYTFDRNSDEGSDLLDETTADEMISFFIDMNSRAQRVQSLPAPLTGTPAYTVTYYSYNLETEYRYYFSTDPTNAYFVDHNGNAYRIANLDAESFVSSQYAVCLYKDAAAPVMQLGASNPVVVLPKTMSWKYKLNNDAYTDAVVPLATGEVSQIVSGMLSLNFDVEPDFLHVQISNGTEMVFEDLYSRLTADIFKENAKYTISVNAQWYESEERESYGEAVYTFNADVRAPAVFYLSETNLLPGDFVAIVGKNVVDPAAVTFTSEPALNFTPVFFRDGENVVALVPVTPDLASDYSTTTFDKMTYTFTVTSDGVPTTLTMTVDEKTFGWSDYKVTAELIASTRTSSHIEEFNTFMEQYLSVQEPVRYWQPSTLFNQPTEANVQTGFGRPRTISINGEKYDVDRHLGVDYMVAAGAGVYAAAPGRVAYVGQQSLSGRLVIIEHGFGLKSVYAHMSSVTVAIGDTVSAGDQLGVVGSTGFTPRTNLHFGLYIFNVPVSPYRLWGEAFSADGKGIVLANP